MDLKDNLDKNNPINWDGADAETCKNCQSDLQVENGEVFCFECDKCIYCGEFLIKCDCIDG